MCTVQQITGQGTLTAPAQAYGVHLAERGTLTVEMLATEFDAYLMLLDASSRQIANDDDSAGNRNARISLMLNPGTYLVVARPYESGAGSYTLATSFAPSGGTAAQPPPPKPDCPWWTLELDQEVRMTLSGSDCAVRQLLGSGADNDRAARYELKLSRRTPVVIDMRSTDFDPYLILLDANLNQIATDDDGGGGLNARIQRTLEPGAYVVVAKALESRQGTYFLHARSGP
jgi:serine protease Do